MYVLCCGGREYALVMGRMEKDFGNSDGEGVFLWFVHSNASVGLTRYDGIWKGRVKVEVLVAGRFGIRRYVPIYSVEIQKSMYSRKMPVEDTLSPLCKPSEELPARRA